jgi:hypothetical protein
MHCIRSEIRSLYKDTLLLFICNKLYNNDGMCMPNKSYAQLVEMMK